MRLLTLSRVVIVAGALLLWMIGLAALERDAPDFAASPWADSAPDATERVETPRPSVNLRTGVQWYRDLAYVAGEEAHEIKHRLDLYLPPDEMWMEGRPLVVWIHGGGWFLGDKDDAMGLYGRFCRNLAEAGVAAANVSYRLSPEATHPDHIRDVAAATAWLRTHADDFGFDPDTIFVSGHSAGGHLAALLAVDPRWLGEHDVSADAIVGALPSSGVYDLAPLIKHGWGFAGAFNATNASDASPVSHLDAGDPPFLLIVEEFGDYMRWQTDLMARSLEEVGIDRSVVEVQTTNHLTMLGDLLDDEGVMLQASLEFIERVLRDSESASTP